MADVAISSKGVPTVPSSPLSNQPTHPSQRSLYHPSLANDMTAGQRLYSPRFGSANSPTYFSYPPPNSPMGSLNSLNGVRGAPPPPSSAHFSGSFVSNFNAYQQFSPNTAQNAISPFLVPNQLSVPNTRPQTYSTGTIDSYHQNSHNAILSANSSSITSQSGLSTSSRSPSLHSSDSSSLLSSGPFSSPPISSEPTEPQTKSMMRSMKDSIDSHNDISARSGPHESTGIKRKSPSSPELNNTEKNLYKLPFGKEGSRKHRILKPPNISILEPNKSDSMVQSAPLSAPPIPVVRRQDFLKRISDSEINAFSKESIVEPNNCHNITSFAHQRRKSVPHTSTYKSLPSLATADTPSDASHYLVPNENCLPIEGHNRLQYPVYFQKGSIIQLGNGNVKRVEEMSTQDFIESATDSPDLCADCSEVIKIEEKMKSCSVLLSFSVGRGKVPVTVEAPVEHPFFVFHKGWSSFSPERSHLRYGLKCRRLRVGDNCVSLTPRSSSAPNLTQSTQKTHKIANKISITGATNRNNSKAKPMFINQKTISPPSESPLSLVKCSTTTSTAPTTNSMPDSNPFKPNELLVTKVESVSSKKAEVSEVSIPSDNVPMSSSDSEPTEAVDTVNQNRRHSAPDAIDETESKPSEEPSNAS